MVPETPDDPVKTTNTSFDILEVLKRSDGATVMDISEDLDIAPSTALRHLETLANRGYATKQGGEYVVGLQPLNYGAYARQSLPFFEDAKIKTESLAKKTDEKVRLITHQNGQSVLLHREVREHPLRVLPHIGNHSPLHQTAGGKAILATMNDARIEAIVDKHGLPKLTERTLSTREELFENIETIRDRGVAYNFQESIEGMNAVGVAIQRTELEQTCALSITGPANRLTEERLQNDLSSLVLEVANEIEINLKYA